MAQFLSPQRIEAAVDRLRQSRASPGMVNFLILKRAAVLSPDGAVNLSLRDEHFQQAITELTWWPTDDHDDHERPFIDVFGSMNARNHGLKKRKYRSNGPADTLKNGAWRPVVAISEGERSKVARLQDNYQDGLAGLTVLRTGDRPMPALADAAVWYYRTRDVEEIVGDASDDAEMERKLAEAFCDEVGLTAEDVAVLFGTEAGNEQ